MKHNSALKCAALTGMVILFLAAVRAHRLIVETTDPSQVVVEIYFENRLPELMFLSHKDPRYLVIGFNSFQIAEGVAFPRERQGFLTELSLEKEGKLILLRARSEQEFSHKLWYSKSQKRYRLVLTAEGSAPSLGEVPLNEAGKALSGEKQSLKYKAPGSIKGKRFELERVILEETGIVLAFRAESPPEFYQKDLPLEADAVQIFFPGATIEPVGDLAAENKDLRCHRELSGTACTVYLRKAGAIFRKMTVRFITVEPGSVANVSAAQPANEKPALIPAEPDTTPLETEIREKTPSEYLPEEPATEPPVAERLETTVEKSDGIYQESKLEEPVSLETSAQTGMAKKEETEATPSPETDETLREIEEPVAQLPQEPSVVTSEEPEKDLQEGAETAKEVLPPTETTEVEANTQTAPSGEGARGLPATVVEEAVPPEAPVSSAVEPGPTSPKKALPTAPTPAVENPWTATLEGDLKQITYQHSPDQSFLKLTFTKQPDFIARAQVSEVVITALNVASDVLKQEFGEGPVAAIEILPDLSGVQILIQIREGYETRLRASGKDIVLDMTKTSSVVPANIAR